jgi:hypothetical protein
MEIQEKTGKTNKNDASFLIMFPMKWLLLGCTPLDGPI